MKLIIPIIIFGIGGVIISWFDFGSDPSVLNGAEYMAYIEEESNGMYVEKTIGDCKYGLQYTPVNYVALRSSGRNHTKEQFDKEKKQYQDLQHFTLKIGLANRKGDILKHNLSDPNEYYERIRKISFEWQQHLKLIDGKDTLACKVYHFERSYGIAPYCKMVMGFEKPKQQNQQNSSKTIICKDNIWGAGKIKLTIQKEDLEKIPALIL